MNLIVLNGRVHGRRMYFAAMNVKTLMSATVVALTLMLAGCANGDGAAEQTAPGSENLTFYGEVIDTVGGLNGEALKTALSLFEGRTQVRFEGEITATCPKKGCWMNVASGRDTVFVRFQDYGFFVPTEGVEGKRTIVEGKPSMTRSVWPTCGTTPRMRALPRRRLPPSPNPSSSWPSWPRACDRELMRAALLSGVFLMTLALSLVQCAGGGQAPKSTLVWPQLSPMCLRNWPSACATSMRNW